MPGTVPTRQITGTMPSLAAGTPVSLLDWSRVSWRLLWCWDAPRIDPAVLDPVAWRSNDHIGFWWLTRGRLGLTFKDGQRQEITAGRALLQPTVPHQEAFSADAALVSIRVEARWPGGRSLRATTGPVIFDDADALLPLARQLVASAGQAYGVPTKRRIFFSAESCPVTDHIAVQCAFWPWFAELTTAMAGVDRHWQPPSHGDARMDALVTLLDGWDLSRPLEAAAVAAATGLSAAGTRRLAIRVLGLTPRDLLERRRQMAAEDLLRDGQLPQRELARHLGFSQATHFGQWFRRRTGLTPEAWRRLGCGV
jgi:AraC-like DNA-binding protein